MTNTRGMANASEFRRRWCRGVTELHTSVYVSFRGYTRVTSRGRMTPPANYAPRAFNDPAMIAGRGNFAV